MGEGGRLCILTEIVLTEFGPGVCRTREPCMPMLAWAAGILRVRFCPWDCFCVEPNLNHTIADSLIMRLPEPSTFFSSVIQSFVLGHFYFNFPFFCHWTWRFFWVLWWSNLHTIGKWWRPDFTLLNVVICMIGKSAWGRAELHKSRSIGPPGKWIAVSQMCFNDITDAQKAYLTAVKPLECVSVEFLVLLLGCWRSWGFSGLTLRRRWFHASFFSPT